MDWNAHNAGFVIAAYALSGAALVLITLWTLLRARAAARAAQKLKPPGV